MGTTSEKLTYLNGTKQLLKDKINNLGGSIDDNTTFRQYANQLQNVYDNLPKTEYQEGTEVNLGNTLKGKLDFDKIYQEVEYISGTGTQYINTGVLGGLDKKVIIKCSVKSIADYTLYGSRQSTGNTVSYISTASATSSWQSGLESSWLRAENNSFVVDEVCTIESYLSSGEQYIKKNGTIIYSGNREVSLATFTQNDYLLAFNNQGSASQMANANLYDCKIYQNNVLVRHFIPCYRKTDNVIGLYDKVEGKFYTNAGTGTFTKGANVGSGFGDIVGIGQSSQDSTKGYQLFDINGNRTDANCTSSVVGNELHQNNLTNYCRTAWKIEGLVVGTSYILTLKYSNPNACSVQARIMDSSNNTVLEQTQARTLASGNFQLTFTAETTTHYIRFYSNTLNSTNTNEVTFYEIMLESGSTAHDWEKYTGGISSPNPSYDEDINSVTGNQDVVVSGKNLVEGLELGEINAQTGAESSASNIVRLKNYIPYSKLKSYRQSVNGENLSSTTGLRFYNQSKEYIGYASFSTSASIQNISITIGTGVTTTDLEPKYFRIRVGTSVLQTDSKYMISNSDDLTYEPYITPTSYQLSLGEYEFNGIGTYKDELVTDRSTGKWYKLGNVGKVTLNGSETNISISAKGRFYMTLTDIMAYTDAGRHIDRIMSNYFHPDTNYSNLYNGSTYQYQNQVYMIMLDNTMENTTEFKTWLSTHNTDLLYALATPTLTEITDTTLINQLEAWYNAKSFTGTVLIQGNGNLPMVIKVRALKGES